MRQKVIIGNTLTDREAFDQLEAGDCWAEAEIIQVWAYLYRNPKLKIPPSWEKTLSNFNVELMDLALSPVLNFKCVHYGTYNSP